MAEGAVILTSVGFLGAFLTAWGALGFPLVAVWWASLVVPAAWGLGIVFRKRGWLGVGFYLLVGLAGAVAVSGRLAAALIVTSCALWSRDLGALWLARVGKEETSATRRLARAGLARSTWLSLTGLGVGLGFAALRVPVPFWGLVGGTIVAWVGVVLLVRALRRYGVGEEASGNRSSS